MHRNLRLVFVLCLLLTIVGNITAQESLQIVASYSILGDVVGVVAGDGADVTVMMPVGADPHSFQPTSGDIANLADADVVFTNGVLFEEGLLESIENADTEMNIIAASSCVQIIPFGEHGHDHDHEAEASDEHDHEAEASDEHDHDHEIDSDDPMAQLCEQHYAEMDELHGRDHEAEEHDHEADEHEGEHHHSEMETLGALYAIDCGEGHSHEHEEGEGHHHDEGSCDPHVWMNPHNVMYWTMLIRDTLIELDPDNAETYTANAANYLSELDALAHDFIHPMVETVPEENRILITNHDSMGYFAASYGFEVVGTIIPSGSTLAEPSATDVADVIDIISLEGVPAIFAETTVNTELAELIAQESGAQVFVLYSGSLGDADSPASTYLDYMRYNVTTIVEALGGGI